MGLDKPQDLAWMFIIFALVIVTFGFGLESINKLQDANRDTSFFDSVRDNATSERGLKGAADDQEDALSASVGAGDSPTVTNFIVQSFESLRNLGKTFSIVQDSLRTSGGMFGLDTIYWTLIVSGLLISFAAVLYTWLRGRI